MFWDCSMLQRCAYRFRLYPTPEQEALFRLTGGACRFLYNLALEQRRLEWLRSQPRHLNAVAQGAELPALKQAAPWLREVPHHTLIQTLRDLDRAYRNWWSGTAAAPSYRKRRDGDRFRFPDPKQFRFEEERIFLPKAGWVRWVQHRPLRGTPKNVTISEDAGCWYAAVQVEVEVAEPAPITAPAVGIDLGVTKPLVLSTGNLVYLPRTGETERRRLAALHRKVARKRKGSKNRAKAKHALARYQAHLARRRRDAAHKATTILAKSHGVIVLEDLRVRAMTASAKGTLEQPGTNVRAKSGLNRSLLDVAPGQIRRMLEYKALWYGSTVIAVNPAYTSQTCSQCGHVHAENRVSQAAFLCCACGHAENADVNAAKVILQRGTGGLPGVACGSSRRSGRKQERRPAMAGSRRLQAAE